MWILVTGVDIWVTKVHHHLNIFDLDMGNIVQITEPTVPVEAIPFIKVQQFKEMKFPVKNSKVVDMDPQLIISSSLGFNSKVTCVTNRECWVRWLNVVKILWVIKLRKDRSQTNMEVQFPNTPDKIKEVKLIMTTSNTTCNSTITGLTKIKAISTLCPNYPAVEIIKIYVLNQTWTNGAFSPDFKITKPKK
jgi:hypothetical protein